MAPPRSGAAVRVYASTRNDHRIRRVAHDLGIKQSDVLGKLCYLWFFAKEQGSEFMERIDAELNLDETPGMLDLLIKHGLVDHVDERTVRVHGIRQEIEEESNRLEQQTLKAAKSVEARRRQGTLQLGTTVDTAVATTVAFSGQPRLRMMSGRTTTKIDESSPESRSEKIKDLGVLSNPARSAPHGAIFETAPPADSGPGPKTQQSPSQEPFQTRQVAKSELPSDALRLGQAMVDWLTSVCPNEEDRKAHKGNARHRKVQSTTNARNLNTLHVSRGIDWLEIEMMIDWVQNHPFWSGVVMTGKSIAQNWDRLSVQRARSTTNGHANGSNGKHAPTTNRGRIEPMPPEAFGDGDVDV